MPRTTAFSRAWRVVVADDDDRFRAAVCDVLAVDSRFELVAQVTSGELLGALVAEHRPDVVLVDVRMPAGGTQAVAAVRAAVAGEERCRVVAMSAQGTSATVAGLVTAGATGFLAKGRLGADLPDLLARCAAGEVVLATDVAADALRLLVDGAAQLAAS